MAPYSAAQPTLPEELLEDIFLRLDDAADLTRAYASCFTFHRIISGRHFLCRYRSLHRPPVVGFLSFAYASGSPTPGDRRCTLRFHPAEPPHCSAPAAAGVARAADFALAFLSDPSCLRVRDVRNGRVLLSRQSVAGFLSEELIVYDPLHRRHIQIGPIPGDLDSPSAGNGMVKLYEPFLDAATDKEMEDEDLPLRVICNVAAPDEEIRIRTFVFTSVTGKWRAVTSFAVGKTFGWLDYLLTLRHYSCRSFCWTVYGKRAMLVLETDEMKFSVVDLPPECRHRSHTLVEAGEGRLGLLIIIGARMLFHYSKSWPNNGDGVKDWRYDNSISLVERRCSWSFIGGAEGYALLKGVPWYPNRIIKDKSSDSTQCFIVEIKTLLVKRLCAMKPDTGGPYYLYASFSPPLSLPSL